MSYTNSQINKHNTGNQEKQCTEYRIACAHFRDEAPHTAVPIVVPKLAEVRNIPLQSRELREQLPRSYIAYYYLLYLPIHLKLK